MSQHGPALRTIEQEAGLSGKLLRPLSAKLMAKTEAEKKGLVNRDGLLAISGPSRKPQFALAKEYGITTYPSPAGGCLLTCEEYAKKNYMTSLNTKNTSLHQTWRCCGLAGIFEWAKTRLLLDATRRKTSF